ncbi:ASN_collapsed_G0009130.mRNA.1.CDS.1 [Saccharomyces cerevisiae]|nr:ASN_collapsed_G0009130.mRNA.1.CDS.1 [Saccharomyces cerevisiae]
MVDSNDDQPERHALLHNDIQTSNNSRPSLVQKKYLPTPQDTRKSRASYTGSAMINPTSKQSRTGSGRSKNITHSTETKTFARRTIPKR